MTLNFGFDEDFNWELLFYLPNQIICDITLNDNQIIELDNMGKIDWNILSQKYLSVTTICSYANKINWNIFLKNKHKKDIRSLMCCVENLGANIRLIDNNYKHLYYNMAFVMSFTNLIDFEWYVCNVQIDEYIILYHWNRFDKHLLVLYQTMSDTILRKKWNEIDWTPVCKKPLTECIMREFHTQLCWRSICRYQRLTKEFMIEYFNYLDLLLICRYQNVTDLPLYLIKKLPKQSISLYQKMSLTYIRENIENLDIENLAKNKNYNIPETIQIIKHNGIWYIFETNLHKKSMVVFL